MICKQLFIGASKQESKLPLFLYITRVFSTSFAYSAVHYNKKVYVAILILARRHFLSDYLLTDHAIEGALIIVIFFAIFIIIIIMLIFVYCYHPLTDHVVERGVIAAGEEVGKEVHHHQPVLLSLVIIIFTVTITYSTTTTTITIISTTTTISSSPSPARSSQPAHHELS